MRALTADQLAAISSGYGPVVRVTVTRPGLGTVALPVIGGTVSHDASSMERVKLTATLPVQDSDGTVWGPMDWDAALVPADATVDVWYGLGVGPDVHVAHLWLDQVRTARPDGIVELTAYSRATRVSQAGFPAGDRRYTGTTAAVVQAVVQAALGHGITMVDQGIGGPAVPAGTTFTGDPWLAVEDLCDAAGGEAFFDVADQLILRRTPTGLGPAVAQLHTGEGGTITAYTVELTRAPNVLRLEYQDPGGTADVVGTAQATGEADPAGPYGIVRDTASRSGRPTQAQANAAAADYLTRAGGLLRTVELECVPHPGVEIGDTVGVTFVSGQLELHRVIGTELPLTPGETMRISTRATPW